MRGGCGCRWSCRRSSPRGNGSRRWSGRSRSGRALYRRLSSRGSDYDGRTRNDRTNGGLARDGGCRRIRDDIGLLARQGNDAARCRRLRRMGSSLSRRRNHAGRGRTRRCCRRWRNHGRTRRWRHGAYCGFGLLALENSFQRIARLGYLGKIELRLLRRRGASRTAAAAAVLEILPDPLGLVGFDRTGVRLSRHADCFERIQNRPAFDFQFSCQIVDSNFAHPSLFASLRP